MITPKDKKLQKIWYLPQIYLSPTKTEVVVETMKRSLKLTEECNRRTIFITYDLAIAKVALQIQNKEKPLYDNIFIALGIFHIELAFFSAIGKVIAGSGGPSILNECEVLAKGSINSFNKGLNYKRCKVIHEKLSLTMKILHVERFLGERDDSNEIFTNTENREGSKKRTELLR